MCTESTEEDEEGEEKESTIIITVVIVEKNVLMTKGHDRSLIHYLVVLHEFCRQYIGAAMFKMSMSQDKYEDRNIIAVTSLPKSYGGVLSYETNGKFFKTFKFLDMKRGKRRRKKKMSIQLS